MQRTFVRIMSVIGVCLLAVGACRDLAISEVLYDPSSWLGILFQEGWPLLLKLLLALSFALLADRKHKFCYGAMLLCCLLFANDVRRLTQASVFSVAIIVGLTFSLLVCAGVSRWLSPWQKERLRPYLQFYLQLFFTVLLLTSALKLVWGRVRYRQMEEASQFCVWYLPCGVQGTSFPSGHTSSFAATVLVVLSLRFPRLRSHARLIGAAVAGSILLMMLSRVIMGAHFVSDTAAGMLIALGCWRFYDRRWEKWFYDHA